MTKVYLVEFRSHRRSWPWRPLPIGDYGWSEGAAIGGRIEAFWDRDKAVEALARQPEYVMGERLKYRLRTVRLP